MPKVLLVDDEPSIRWTMAEFLKREGYDAVTASDFESALECFQQNRLDAAVVDIILPRKSGIELLKELRARAPRLPVIMITGEPNISQMPDIVRAGAYDFISKPVSKHVLVKIVSRAVEHKRLSDEKLDLEEQLKKHTEQLETTIAARTTELRESEQRYRLLFESNPQPMWVFDYDTLRFLAVNDAAVRHYGYSREEFLSMTLKDIRPAADVPALLDDLTKTGAEFEAKSGPWRHRTKDGALILIEVSTHTLDFDGHQAALALLTDITARKAAEEELRQMQERLVHNEKIAALGRVAAQVAHEVKNPLAGLRLYSLHLKNKVAGKLADNEMDIINKIADGIGRLTETTEQILSFARPINMNLTRVNLNTVVSDTAQLLEPQSASNSIALKLELAEPAPTGMLDEASIHAALMNLMLNAIQAMQGGGTLTVKTGMRDDALLIDITDTGKGMSEEQVRNVFEPFYTTKAQGLGLGMPYAKKIIEQHQGAIRVESREGAGTSIEIELPAGS
ncbi:MAG TPA: response regulator [Pyrinomonadaceae bacterium]|jgi:PAS domain S-box-containing protein